MRLLKIASILGHSNRKNNGFLPIMMMATDDEIYNHYLSIIIDLYKDDYIFQKSTKQIIDMGSSFNPIFYDRYPFECDIELENKPEIGKSISIPGWRSSIITNIVDNNIIFTLNSVYVLHSISDLRDKKLKDLGI